MRSAEEIITLVRQITDNEDYGENSGVSQSELLFYAQEAQEKLQSEIFKRHPSIKIFDTTYDYTLVSRQNAYAIPSNAYLRKIRNVQLRINSGDDFFCLRQREVPELREQESTYPCHYGIRGKNVIVSPMPTTSTGTLRIVYPKKLDIITEKAAEVSAVGSGWVDVVNASSNLQSARYVCICDKDGVVVDYNLPVTSFNSSSGRIITTTSDISAISGYSVTSGKYTTTHCQLDDEVESFIVAYMLSKIYKRESSTDYSVQMAEMSSLLQDILHLYGFELDEIDVPITSDWLAI